MGCEEDEGWSYPGNWGIRRALCTLLDQNLVVFEPVSVLQTTP